MNFLVSVPEQAPADLAWDGWLFVVRYGSGGMEDAAMQEPEAGTAVGLALDELEAVDPALGLSVAPRRGQRRANGAAVLRESRGEGLDRRDAAGPRFRDPGVQGATQRGRTKASTARRRADGRPTNRRSSARSRCCGSPTLGLGRSVTGRLCATPRSGLVRRQVGTSPTHRAPGHRDQRPRPRTLTRKPQPVDQLRAPVLGVRPAATPW